MKRTLFDLSRSDPGDPCRVRLPLCFTPVLDLMRDHGLSLQTVSAGMNGIELYSDPTRHTYLECGIYQRKPDYMKKKRQYLDYLRRNAAAIDDLFGGRVQQAELRNDLHAVLVMNDEDLVLLWETERSHIQHLKPSALLFAAAGGTGGELPADPETNVPVIHSRDMRSAAEPAGKCGCPLRSDGFFVLKKKNAAEYLRFFPSGKVVGFLSDKDSAAFLRDRMDEEFEENGSYRVRGDRIAFDLTFLDGGLHAQYAGTVGADGLTLFKKVLGTSFPRQLGLYRFLPFDEDEGGGSDRD